MPTPEQEADRLLRESGWDGIFPVNPVKIADFCQIGVLRDKELVGSSNSGRCVITESGDKAIIVNPADSPARQRFTVAHELGHAMLDEHGLHERNIKLKMYRRKEALANRFAAALLMPEKDVRSAFERGMKIEQMAAYFGVSQAAMQIRLIRLGLLPDVW